MSVNFKPSFFDLILCLPFSYLSGSSFAQRFTVPQKYFLHFYIVAVVWTTLLLVLFTLSYAHWKMTRFHLVDHQSIGQMDLVWRSHIFMLMLMELQVLRRLFETVYVFDYGSSARMHIAGYFTGL